MLEHAGVCRAITLCLAQRLRGLPEFESQLGGGLPLSAAQRKNLLSNLFAGLEEWVLSWPEGSTPYDGLAMSAELKSKLVAMVRAQVKMLVTKSEELSADLTENITNLAKKCLIFKSSAQFANDGVATHLGQQIGLYAPLAKPVAEAWELSFNSVAGVQIKRQLQEWQAQARSTDELVDFIEQLMEGEAAQALLQEFGHQLRWFLDNVEQDSLMHLEIPHKVNPDNVNPDNVKLQVYADLIFMQQSLLVQYQRQLANR
jgi:hypothetical protein